MKQWNKLPFQTNVEGYIQLDNNIIGDNYNRIICINNRI